MSLSLRPGYVYEVFERQCEIGAGQPGQDPRGSGRQAHSRLRYRHRFRRPAGPFISPQAPTGTCSSLFMSGSTTGSTSTPPGRASSTPAGRSGACSTTSSTPASTSSTRCSPRRRAWPRRRLKTEFRRPGHVLGRRHRHPEDCCPLARRTRCGPWSDERMRIFGRGGGFVFNTVHNVQAGVPTENLVALYQAVNDFRGYPLG